MTTGDCCTYVMLIIVVVNIRIIAFITTPRWTKDG